MDYYDVIREFVDHARHEYPHEACGLVVVFKGRPRLFFCNNAAGDTLNDFAITPEDYARAEQVGDVVGVLHSHNGSAKPSPLDIQSQRASGVQWWIVGLESETSAEAIEYMPAISAEPIFGRVFVHGVTDCYSLIRDWYAAERGIELPDFARTNEWWHKGENLYIDGFPKAGFVEVKDALQVGDVLLMNIGANVANHAAIYVGDDKIAHHLHGRLSSIDFYSGFYRDRTIKQLRYAGS